MKLIVLGSGTSIPHPKRASPAFWLETAGGSILLDASADAPHRMAEEGLDWPSLDAIWISHFHLDHMAGLYPLLFGMKWSPQMQQRDKTLRIFGGPGIEELISLVDRAGNYRLLEQHFPLEIVEVEANQTFAILPGVSAKTLSTPHTQESMALYLSEQGISSIVYTSDTGFSKELARFAGPVDLLLLECSFRRNKPLQTHLELGEAMQVAAETAPGKLILTHLYPEWDGIDLVSEAKALWSGEILEATDGLRVTI
jgi:ribonuclease BN (tRNA processing enzyme)